MATNIIPILGTKGVWSAKSPYSGLILSNVIYTCTALRSLIEIIANGDDPQALYYTPYGVNSATYAADVAAGAVIITLMADDNSKVNIPSTYLALYPDGNGVGYRIMGLGVRLTALPDSLDLSALIDKLSSDCIDMIGVTPTITELSLSNPQLINSEDNTNLETQRKSRITNSTTDYAKLQVALAQKETLQQRCKMLEDYIFKLEHLEST